MIIYLIRRGVKSPCLGKSRSCLSDNKMAIGYQMPFPKGQSAIILEAERQISHYIKRYRSELLKQQVFPNCLSTGPLSDQYATAYQWEQFGSDNHIPASVSVNAKKGGSSSKASYP